MELLDRYLNAVKAHLPKTQQADILAELSENILSEMEDREAQLGRPLNEAEQEALLQQIGNPILVAGRYRQDQQSLAFGRQLIGPLLFPCYIRVLSINMGLTGIVCFLVNLLLDRPITNALSGTILPLLLSFGFVTGIFTLAESHLTRYPDAWTSQNPLFGLPPDEREETPRVSRFDSFAQLLIYISGLFGLRVLKPLVFGLSTAPLQAGPVWRDIYWPVALLVAAGILQASVTLYRPDLTRFRLWTRIGMGCIGLAVMLYLLRAGDWVILAQTAGSDVEKHRRGVEFVNHWIIFQTLLITALVMALQLLQDLLRLKGRENRVLSWFTAS